MRIDVNKRLREGKLTLDEDTQAIGVAEGIAEAEMELAAIEKLDFAFYGLLSWN